MDQREEKTIHGIMTTRVISVAMDDTLQSIRRIFNTRNLHHLLVMEGELLCGVISDRDLLRALSPFMDSAAEQVRDTVVLQKRAHQIMTRQPIVAHPDDTLDTAAALMRYHKISCLPIVDYQLQVQGIVTLRDLVDEAFPKRPGRRVPRSILDAKPEEEKEENHKTPPR